MLPGKKMICRPALCHVMLCCYSMLSCYATRKTSHTWYLILKDPPMSYSCLSHVPDQKLQKLQKLSTSPDVNHYSVGCDSSPRSKTESFGQLILRVPFPMNVTWHGFRKIVTRSDFDSPVRLDREKCSWKIPSITTLFISRHLLPYLHNHSPISIYPCSLTSTSSTFSSSSSYIQSFSLINSSYLWDFYSRIHLVLPNFKFFKSLSKNFWQNANQVDSRDWPDCKRFPYLIHFFRHSFESLHPFRLNLLTFVISCYLNYLKLPGWFPITKP